MIAAVECWRDEWCRSRKIKASYTSYTVEGFQTEKIHCFDNLIHVKFQEVKMTSTVDTEEYALHVRLEGFQLHDSCI